VEITGRGNQVHGGNREIFDRCDGGNIRYRPKIINLYVERSTRKRYRKEGNAEDEKLEK
jgi:hypothetical protein